MLASIKILVYDDKNAIFGVYIMKFFQKKEKMIPIPKECEDFAIEVDKSICTGEMTVGFRNPKTGRLLYAELARSDAEVKAYQKKYGR